MSNIYKNKYKNLLGEWYRIHPGVKFGENVRIGENVVIEDGCEIGDNCLIGHNVVMRPRVKIGNNTMIGHGTVFEGDAWTGNNITIHSQCHITQYVIIEDQTFIGPGTILINTYRISHGRSFPARLRGPHVGYGCRVGSGSVLMPGVTLGREVVIGANATVTRDCDSFGIYIGSPAKFVKAVPEDEYL